MGSGTGSHLLSCVLGLSLLLDSVDHSLMGLRVGYWGRYLRSCNCMSQVRMPCTLISSSESHLLGVADDRISIATVVSFAARGLATTGLFCYQAVVSAGVCLILPGYAICTSHLFNGADDSMRLPRTSFQEHHVRFRPNGLCHHLLALPRIRNHHRIRSILRNGPRCSSKRCPSRSGIKSNDHHHRFFCSNRKRDRSELRSRLCPIQRIIHFFQFLHRLGRCPLIERCCYL